MGAPSNFCNDPDVSQRHALKPRGNAVFQIVHCVLDDKKEVLARRPLEPLFELWEDAAAMAEFDSSRLWDEYGYDEERSCWWSRDSRGRIFRFEVEEVTAVEEGSTPERRAR
jgi:hypothetical protein